MGGLFSSANPWAPEEATMNQLLRSFDKFTEGPMSVKKMRTKANEFLTDRSAKHLLQLLPDDHDRYTFLQLALDDKTHDVYTMALKAPGEIRVFVDHPNAWLRIQTDNPRTFGNIQAVWLLNRPHVGRFLVNAVESGSFEDRQGNFLLLDALDAFDKQDASEPVVAASATEDMGTSPVYE